MFRKITQSDLTDYLKKISPQDWKRTWWIDGRELLLTRYITKMDVTILYIQNPFNPDCGYFKEVIGKLPWKKAEDQLMKEYCRIFETPPMFL